MVTFQLQRLHYKTQNGKRKHQNCLNPKCNTPVKLASNLHIIWNFEADSFTDDTLKKKQMDTRCVNNFHNKQFSEYGTIDHIYKPIYIIINELRSMSIKLASIICSKSMSS